MSLELIKRDNIDYAELENNWNKCIEWLVERTSNIFKIENIETATKVFVDSILKENYNCENDQYLIVVSEDNKISRYNFNRFYLHINDEQGFDIIIFNKKIRLTVDITVVVGEDLIPRIDGKRFYMFINKEGFPVLRLLKD